MTLPNWGNVTPSQMAMLALAGHMLSREYFPPGTIHPDADRLDSMRWGLDELRSMTCEDFGYDLGFWHEYLLVNDKSYQHPFAWDSVRPAIEQAISDPDRGRLERLLKGE